MRDAQAGALRTPPRRPAGARALARGAAALVAAAAVLVSPLVMGPAAASDGGGAGGAVEVEIGASPGGSREQDVSVFPPRVLVPGDTETRVLRVRNAGDTDAVLTATLRDKEHTDAYDDGLYDLLTVNGLALSALVDAGADVVLHEVPLPQGGVADLPFELTLPVTTAGNAAVTGERAVEFDVVLTLAADATPAPGGSGAGPDGEAGAGAAPGPGSGAWAATGGQLVAGQPAWVWGAALLMAATAAGLLRHALRPQPVRARARRRRCAGAVGHRPAP